MNTGITHEACGNKGKNSSASGRACGHLIFCYFCLFTFYLGSFALAQTRTAWQAEWEKTVAAAKKEGEVHVYISGWGTVIDSGQFQRAYPEIRVVAVTGKGALIAQQDRPTFPPLTDGHADTAAHVDRGWDPAAEPARQRIPHLDEGAGLSLPDLTHAARQ